MLSPGSVYVTYSRTVPSLRVEVSELLWFRGQLLFVQKYIKVYRTMILPVVLYGSEAWSLSLREECSLRVFENRVLFGPKRDEVTRGGENYIMRNLMICTAHPILFGGSDREE